MMTQIKYEESLQRYNKYVEEYKEKSYEVAAVIRLELEEAPLTQTQYVKEVRDL